MKDLSRASYVTLRKHNGLNYTLQKTSPSPSPSTFFGNRVFAIKPRIKERDHSGFQVGPNPKDWSPCKRENRGVKDKETGTSVTGERGRGCTSVVVTS
jgi:hypothetical protein